MTALTGKEIEKRLDHPLFTDAYLTGLGATVAVFGLAGWGVGWGILAGLLLGLAAVLVIAVACGIASGDDPLAVRGRLLGTTLYALLIAYFAHRYAGVPALVVPAAVFAYHTAMIVHRQRALPPGAFALPDPAKQKAQPPALPAFATLPGPVGLAYAQLPADLGADLRARVDAALENYRQLLEILHDPILLTHIAVDAPGMIAAAEEIALDLLRQVPRLARIQALAARRNDDDARAAALAAFASLDRHAAALHDAAAAAFKIVAADPSGDTQGLREHTDRLHSLRAVHDELQTH